MVEEDKRASSLVDAKMAQETEVVPEFLRVNYYGLPLREVKIMYRAIAHAKVPLEIVEDINQADILLTLKVAMQ